jgi:hypothetical protein
MEKQRVFLGDRKTADCRQVVFNGGFNRVLLDAFRLGSFPSRFSFIHLRIS